jgi:succinate-acetate transporter protein
MRAAQAAVSDLSPNNRVIAMAMRYAGCERLVASRKSLAIDNIPTPSYLSNGLGWFCVSRRYCPKSAVFPERRKQNPGAAAW